MDYFKHPMSSSEEVRLERDLVNIVESSMDSADLSGMSSYERRQWSVNAIHDWLVRNRLRLTDDIPPVMVDAGVEAAECGDHKDCATCINQDDC